jgi:methylglyoxal/glyoxal reductase
MTRKEFKMLNVYSELSNGVKIPKLGFGTYKIENGKQTMEAVKTALEVGYRHIDTASMYNNEEGVGKAIKESGIPREEIFITSKVWNTDQGFENTIKAFQASIERLGTEYLDLYLIHWPKPLFKETWRAIEKLYKDGRLRSIGVSNFREHHLLDLMETAKIRPMVNQVEFHPQLSQPELLKFCREYHIQVVAWGPLMRGGLYKVIQLKELSEKYNKTVAQIVLRWDIQQGIVTIPKSKTPERIQSNAEIFDFELSEEDMQKIAMLNTGERIGPDPDKINF